MFDAHINIQQIEEMKELFEPINNLRSAISVGVLDIGTEKLHKEALIFCQKEYEKFSINEKQLLGKIEKWIIHKEEVSLYEQYNETEIVNVMNYIYWKYKNNSSEHKVDLTKLKRIFNLKSNTKYKKKIKIRMKCKMCKENGYLYIESYNDTSSKEFICTNCNHTVNMERGNCFPSPCTCKYCEKLEEDIVKSLRSNLPIVFKKLEDNIIRLYNRYNVNKVIDDDTMLIDWKVFKLDLDKDIQELLSYNPKDEKSLDIIINKINERYLYYNDKSYKEKIYEKLLKLRMIYKINEREVYNPIEQFTNIITDVNNNKDNLDDILFFLKENNSLEDYKRCISINRRDERINFIINKKSIAVNFNYCHIYGIKDSDNRYVLNKYFFNFDEEILYANKNENLLNLFQSQCEENMFNILVRKYPSNRIEINRRISDFINVEKFKSLFNKNEYNYLLNKAEVNFIVCDKKTNPIKVVQVNRGEHHNQQEWIERDKLKKKICVYAGLDFEVVY